MKTFVKALLTVALLSGCQILPGGVEIKGDPGLGTLRGVLRDTTGKPASNVSIKVYKVAQSSGASDFRIAATDAAISGTSLSASGTTEQDGSFVITNVPTGEVTVEAIKSDAEKAIAMNVAVAAGSEIKLDNFTLAETGAISGKVTSTRPETDLFGVDVFIPGTSFTAKTDEDGNYTILYVPVGTFRLAGVMSGYSRAILEGVKVESKKVTSAPDLTFYYGARVSGSVELIDQDVDPTSITVIMYGIPTEYEYPAPPRETKMAPDFTYTFPDVKEGKYQISFRSPIAMPGMTYTRPDGTQMLMDQGMSIYYFGNDKPYNYLNASVTKGDFGDVVTIGKVKLKKWTPPEPEPPAINIFGNAFLSDGLDSGNIVAHLTIKDSLPKKELTARLNLPKTQEVQEYAGLPGFGFKFYSTDFPGGVYVLSFTEEVVNNGKIEHKPLHMVKTNGDVLDSWNLGTYYPSGSATILFIRLKRITNQE